MNRSWTLAPLAAGLLMLSILSPVGAQPVPATSPTTAPTAASGSTRVPTQLWDFQKQLGLSDQQVATMKQDFNTLKSKLRPGKLKLRDLYGQASQMVRQNANLPLIRAKLQEAANLQVEMQMTDIETARTINKLMTAEQIKKWDDLKAKLLQAQQQQQQQQQQQNQAPPPNGR